MVILSDASVSTMESAGVRRNLVKSSFKTALKKPDQYTIKFAAEDQYEYRLIPICWEFSVDDVRAMWYCGTDFERFKAESKVLAKETRLLGPRATGPVDEGYRKVQLMAFTVGEDSLPDFLVNVKKHSEELVLWSKRKLTCRGLEHWTSKNHYTARNETKSDVRTIVMEFQELGESPEGIARQSLEYSRSSRIMARLLGDADSHFKVSQKSRERLTNEIMETYRRNLSGECPFPVDDLPRPHDDNAFLQRVA